MAREVICDFEGRRRPVSFCFSDLDSVKEAHDHFFSAVKTAFSDLISWKEEDSYFLQVDTRRHGRIDVLGCSEPVEDGAVVFLRYWRSSLEDDVSSMLYKLLLYYSIAYL